MQKKLAAYQFEYSAQSERELVVFAELQQLDLLSEENLDDQKILIRDKIADKDKYVSQCIQQLMHVFSHDIMQNKDLSEQTETND